MICTFQNTRQKARFYRFSNVRSRGKYSRGYWCKYFFKDKSGSLHTPIPDSFLDGITRRCAIEIAKSKGIKIVERKIKPDEMSDFVGCFLTGTAAEITPVLKSTSLLLKFVI